MTPLSNASLGSISNRAEELRRYFVVRQVFEQNRVPSPRFRGSSLKFDLAKLKGAAKLFIELALDLNCLGNGLPVDNLGFADIHIDVEL